MNSISFNADNRADYLRQISKIPRLPCNEVLRYAKQVQQMMQLQEQRQKLYKQLDQNPTLAQWAQQVQLSEMALHSALLTGKRAKQTLIEAHLYLVVTIARRYQNRGLELHDLSQEGSVGLSRGVEKFDPTKGYQFSTYVRWWISRDIRRAVILKDKDKKTIIQGEPTKILEQIKSKSPLPEEMVAHSQQGELVRQLVARLTPKQQKVLLVMYGLEDGNSLSLSQAGKKLGLSLGQVRYAHDTALEILKQFVPSICLI